VPPHQHLLDDPAIERVDVGHGLKRRQRDLVAVGAHPRPSHGDLPAAEHHVAADGPGARRTELGPVGIPRTAEHGAVLFQHRFQHLQARSHGQLEELSARIHQEIDQQKMAGRFNSGRVGDCARLLHGGSFAERRVASVWPPLVYHEQ
jgi:hypothetical protein